MRADCYIDGRWVPAGSGKRFPVENPATEEILAEVPSGDAADIDRAVKAARACFEGDPWRGITRRRQGLGRATRRLAALAAEHG